MGLHGLLQGELYLFFIGRKRFSVLPSLLGPAILDIGPRGWHHVVLQLYTNVSEEHVFPPSMYKYVEWFISWVI
jgi:hypothetical protein